MGGYERRGRIKIEKKRLFIVITLRNLANKTQKSAFFIKKNDYKCMSAAAEQLLSHARN